VNPIRSAVTISLVPEARGGPFVYWETLAESCRRAKSLGFDGVEIFSPGPETLRDPALAEVVFGSGLFIAALGTGAGWLKHKLRLTDAQAEIRLRAIEFLREMLEAASRLAAPLIIGSMQGRWEGAVSKAEALDWLGEGMSELDTLAGRLGGRLLLEPLNRYESNLLNRTSEGMEFIRRHECRNTMVLADLYHMNIEEADVGEALRDLGESLGHVHFADSNRLAMGLGHTDAGRVARVLKSMEYDGYVSAEVLPLPSSDEAAAQTIRTFRACFG